MVWYSASCFFQTPRNVDLDCWQLDLDTMFANVKSKANNDQISQIKDRNRYFLCKILWTIFSAHFYYISTSNYMQLGEVIFKKLRINSKFLPSTKLYSSSKSVSLPIDLRRQLFSQVASVRSKSAYSLSCKIWKVSNWN